MCIRDSSSAMRSSGHNGIKREYKISRQITSRCPLAACASSDQTWMPTSAWTPSYRGCRHDYDQTSASAPARAADPLPSSRRSTGILLQQHRRQQLLLLLLHIISPMTDTTSFSLSTPFPSLSSSSKRFVNSSLLYSPDTHTHTLHIVSK